MFKNDYQLKTLKFQKVIKSYQFHYFNKVVEKSKVTCNL